MKYRFICKYSEKARRLQESGMSKEDMILEFRDMVEEMESRILAITGDPFNYSYGHVWTHKGTLEHEEVDALLRERQSIMNRMFFLHKSAAEIDRFKQLNTLLKDLTDMIYRRTGAIYRRLLAGPMDPGFDDDYEVEGTIRYDCSSEEDVLRLEDDSFYNSSFKQMLAVIEACDEITPEIITAHPDWCWKNHRADMTDKELGLVNELDDGQTWDEYHIPELADIVVCHAVHEITDHKNYSIPDFLRMNSFWCEVKTLTQHIVAQDGTR